MFDPIFKHRIFAPSYQRPRTAALSIPLEDWFEQC